MPDIVSEQFIQVARDLVVVFIGYQSYRLGKSAAVKRGRLRAIAVCGAWCVGLAALAALMLGNGSCADIEMFGYCDGEGAYEPDLTARLAQFLYWSAFLVAPAFYGIARANEFSPNPWGRPKNRAPNIAD